MIGTECFFKKCEGECNIFLLHSMKAYRRVLMCVFPVVLLQHVTMKQSVYTQATCFGCTRQPLSGVKFRKYKKGNHTALAIQATFADI